MAQLNIYDKFGTHLESHLVEDSLLSWMKKSVEHYSDTIRPPYSAILNGKPWAYTDHDQKLDEDDIVDLTIEPASAGAFYIVIAIVSAAYSYYQISNLPDGYQSSQEPGKSIYNANARANSIKPNAVVRQAAGTYPIFPDIICPVRRKYIDNDEYIYLMLCISDGYMYLREDNFYIAETPILNYAGDYTLSIFEPGDDVSVNEAHENWFESKEVLSLELTTDVSNIPGNWTATYSGNSITTYLDGVLEEFPFPVDALLSITLGSNQGFYIVESIGSPNHTAYLRDTQRPAAGLLLSASAISRLSNVQPVNTSSGIVFPVPPSYTDRAYEATTASPSATLVSVSPAEPIAFAAQNGGVNWEGPFEVIPVNETARYAEVDVLFPNGLVLTDTSGTLNETTVEIEIQYREVGTDTWFYVTDSSRSPHFTQYTNSTYDQLGFTVEIDMGSSIRPEFRFRRVTKDSQSISQQDTVVIKRVRCKLETPTSYANVTTAALILRGTNSLATTAENKINIRGAIRKLPTLTEIQDAAGGTPFDISSSVTQTTSTGLVNDSATFVGSFQFTNPSNYPDTTIFNRLSAHINSDGTKMLSYEEGVLRQYDFSVPFSVKDGFTYGTFSLAGASTKPRNAMWMNSGNLVAFMRLSKDPGNITSIDVRSLASPYDLTGASITSPDNSYTAGGGEIVDGIWFYVQDDGLRFWIADKFDNKIYVYDNSTAFEFNTATQLLAGSPLTAVSFDFSSSPSANIQSFWLGNYSAASPTTLWICDSLDTIHEYTLSIAGDITSASLDGSYENLGGIGIQVTDNYLYNTSVVTESGKTDSPQLREGEITQYVLQTVSDSRSTRSIVRFAANALYDALGSEVLNIIDWTTMASLDATLESRSDYFDGEFVDQTTLWEALRIIFSPGYTEPAMKEGKLTPIRTVAGSDYSHVYTPDFMLDDGLVIEDSYYDGIDADGVDVEYLDEDSGEMEVVECRLSGDLGFRPKQIQAIGITNRTRAWRLGMRERRRIFYKPSVYTFASEMDGLNSEYGDAIGVASDVFGSQFGTVIAASGDSITLDFIPTFDTATSPMDTYFAAFKKPEGTMSGLYTIAQGSPNNVITILDSPGLDFTPVTVSSPVGENTTVTIGKASEWGRRAIVKRVSPEGDEKVTIFSEEYVAEMYADDNNAPP